MQRITSPQRNNYMSRREAPQLLQSKRVAHHQLPEISAVRPRSLLSEGCLPIRATEQCSTYRPKGSAIPLRYDHSLPNAIDSAGNSVPDTRHQIGSLLDCHLTLDHHRNIVRWNLPVSGTAVAAISTRKGSGKTTRQRSRSGKGRQFENAGKDQLWSPRSRRELEQWDGDWTPAKNTKPKGKSKGKGKSQGKDRNGHKDQTWKSEWKDDSAELCNKFQKNECTRKDCKYKHACKKCGKKGHGEVDCWN